MLKLEPVAILEHQNGEDPRIRTVKSLDACGFGVDGSGSIYACEAGSVLRIRPGGESETIAGSRIAQGFAGDNGPARDARFGWIRGIAVTTGGDVYVSDVSSARLSHPGGLLAGEDGTIYFTDGDRISVVSSGSGVATLGGQSNPGLCGDGAPVSDACFRFTRC